MVHVLQLDENTLILQKWINGTLEHRYGIIGTVIEHNNLREL